MRYHITHSQVTKGCLIRRSYFCVSVQCEFDWWELQVIRDEKLQSYVLIDRMPSDKWPTEDIGMHALTAAHLLNGRVDKFHCRTSEQAATYEEELCQGLDSFTSRLGSRKS